MIAAGTALFGFANEAARAQAPLPYQSSTYETSGLPGFRLSTQPDLTSPTDPSIATFYGNPASPAAATPSARITALARSLENDPDRIYQFVRNSIAFEPQFGLHKGADGVLLDGSGGAFDQAQLMIELLRASGRPARFALGTVSLGPEAASILRVNGARQACELLATAGTPATVNTLTDCATVSGAVANVTMMHVWVEAQLTSGGPWYVFDPSLKQTTKVNGVDLWAASGTSASAAWNNVSSGVSSGQPNLTGVNAANIQGDLAGYAQTLQADLIANHSDKSLEQLTGGWDIKRVTDAPRVTSLPGYTASTRWTGEVPDIYRAKLTLQTTNFAHVFDLPSIYGWRVQGQMQGNTEANQTPSGGFVVAVRKCEHLNAAATAYFTKLAVSPCETQNTVEGDPVNFATWDRRLTLTINHPYVASRTGASITGSFGDEAVTKSIEWGKRVDILVRTAGGNGNRRAVWAAENDPIQQHRVIPAGDPYVPCANNPATGANDGSEKPEQYGVCDGRGAPDWTYTVQAPLPGVGGGGGVALLFSRGEIARAEMGSKKDGLLNTWTDLFDKTTGVMEGLSGARIFHQHSIGVALTPSYTENALDIDTAVGISTAGSDQPHQVLAALASLSVTEEALAIGQLATERPGSPGSPIQDTAARRMSPGTGLVVLTTTAGLSGLPASVSDDTKDQMEYYLTKGFQVVVNTTANQNAFLARRADGSEQAWIIRAQTFGQTPDVDPRTAFRKGSVTGTPNPIDYLGKAEARQLAANVAGTRLGSVDLRNGTLSFSEGTELSIGQGDFPYSLSFSRTYSSTGPVEGLSGLGMGWTHNWESSVSRSSDVNALTPDAEAVTAAPMLMAAMIALEAGRANTVEASVVSGVALDWLQNQAAYNVANVNGGGQSARFVRLVNGTWRNPASAADALTPAPGITDSIYNKQYDWRLADRSVMAFRDIPNTAPGQFDMGLQGALVGWTFPTGVEITLTYGGQDRTNRPTLASVFNNVGAKLEFTHSQSVSYEDTEQCYRDVIGYYPNYADGYRDAQQLCYDASIRGGRLENVKAGPDQISFGYNPFCTQNVNFCAVELISADRPGQRKREYVYGTPAGALATAFSPADYQQVLVEVRDENVTTPRARFVWVATGGQVAPYVAESRDAQDRKTTYYSSTFTYSAAQDAANAIVRQTYDEDGRLATSADGMGRVSEARYDGPGRTVWLKTAFGDTSTFTYDSLGNLIKREQLPIEGCATGLTAEQQAWWCQTIAIEAVYGDAVWKTKPTKIILPATAADTDPDPESRTWEIDYNEQGLTASITAPEVPDGAAAGAPMVHPVWTTEYDNRGRVSATVDPTGVRTTMTYTAGPTGRADCMTQQVQGAQSATDKITTTFTCDLVGNVLTTTVGGATTTATYDEFRRKRSEDGPAGTNIRSRWEYNIDGDLAETKRWDTAGGGRWLVTLTDYSATHQPLTVREPGPTGAATGDITRTCYDAVDRPVAVIDGERRATRTVYNAAGQPTEIHRFQRAGVNSCGMVTELPGTDFTETRWRRFQYNAGGLQSAEIDARGATTQQIYDGLGRPAKLLYADGTQSWTAQDQRGQAILRRQPSGHRASIFYDAMGRDYHVREYAEADKDYKWRGRNVRASYDRVGRPMWRDVSNQTTLTTTFDDVLRRDIRNYAYADGLGRVTSAQWRPEGVGGISYTTGYGYADGRGNRTSISQPQQGGGTWTISYVYNLANRVQSVSFPGVGGTAQTVAISHDSLSRRTGIDRPGAAADTTYAYETDDDLLTLSHGFTAGTGPGSTTFAFGHDASAKLTSIAIDQPAFEWLPSAMDEAYGAASVMNRISSVAGTAVTWDGNGNMRSDGVNTYTWTYGNRMAGASRSGMTATYDYDSDDRRTKKVVNGVMTRTLWSGADELAEYDAAGGLLRRFVPDGTGAMDARLATVEFNQATGAATGVFWHHTDHQGSVIATSDSSGQTTGIATYSPYGEFAAGVTTPPAHSPFGYTGRQYDPETGLYQYRARYYSPRLGQFLSTDPIGTKDDPNLYLYVGLDPASSIDPSGRSRLCAETTGSRIERCVATSTPLDDDQKEALERDFRTFIVSPWNNNRNISSFAKPIGGTGSQRDVRMVSVVSQFVGSALALRGGDLYRQWQQIPSIWIEPDSNHMNAPAELTTADEIIFQKNSLPYMNSPSNLARWMIHETFHVDTPNSQLGGMLYGTVAELFHKDIDRVARVRLMESGLNGGGCVAMGGFPSC